MSTNSENEQRKLHTISLINGSPELLPRRKYHQSSKKTRTNSSKLTKDEIKYQRFVHDLNRNIQVYMKECLRESRFHTRDKQYLKMNPSFQLLRTTLKPKPAPSTISSYRPTGTEIIIALTSNRQDPMSFLKYNETKRLEADVQNILTGPAMKTFYTEFIRPLPQQQQPIPFEESFLSFSEH